MEGDESDSSCTLMILNLVPNLSCSRVPHPTTGTAFRARSSPVEKQGMETSPLCVRVNSAPPFPYFGGHPGWQALHSRSEGSCTCSYKGMNHRTSDLKFTEDLFLWRDEFVI